MAKKVDLSKYSLADLHALQGYVEKAIADHKSQARTKAMKEMQAIAKKHGLSVDDVVGRKGKGKKAAKAPAPAKYRNPADANETWSGRGRQPAWFKAAVKKGKTPASLEI